MKKIFYFIIPFLFIGAIFLKPKKEIYYINIAKNNNFAKVLIVNTQNIVIEEIDLIINDTLQIKKLQSLYETQIGSENKKHLIETYKSLK